MSKGVEKPFYSPCSYCPLGCQRPGHVQWVTEHVRETYLESGPGHWTSPVHQDLAIGNCLIGLVLSRSRTYPGVLSRIWLSGQTSTVWGLSR
jgi:hypothetical protein